MDLKLIRTFVTAAKENNLTRTAQILGYAQSTVTSQIQLLEDELQMNLFDRLGKSIYLSGNGKAFLPYATQLLSMEQEIKETFCKDYDQAPLSIGTSQSLCNTLLPPLIGRYQKLYPQTPLTIHIDNSLELSSLLRTNEIDVAICMKHGANMNELFSYGTKQEPISFFASAQHPITNVDSLTINQLCSYPFILTAKDCYYHRTLLNYLSDQNLSYQIFLESDNLNLLKQFAIQGSGILFLPEIAVCEEVRNHQLRKLSLVDTPCFQSQSQILLHKQKHLSIGLKRFLELAEEYF